MKRELTAFYRNQHGEEYHLRPGRFFTKRPRFQPKDPVVPDHRVFTHHLAFYPGCCRTNMASYYRGMFTEPLYWRDM